MSSLQTQPVEAVAWLRDAHEGVGDECLVPAAKGDPGAFPVYTHPSATAKTVREWLDEPEGHSIRMERLVEDLENGADIIPWLEAAAALKAAPAATERMRAEREDEIVLNAMSLFRAFIGGSASRDVQNGTMTQAQADSWKAHTIRQHEESLREMAGVAAFGEA